MSRLEELKQRIEDRDARIGVIGLGYVGLPLAVEFAKAGYTVAGFDLDETITERYFVCAVHDAGTLHIVADGLFDQEVMWKGVTQACGRAIGREIGRDRIRIIGVAVETRLDAP